MATNVYTTTYLLANLKRRGMIPATDEALATADYLSFADDELQTELVQMLLSVREEYLLAKSPYDLAITSSQSQYPIPPRAIAGRLRQVLISSGSDYVPLQRIEPDDALEGGTVGTASGYEFDGNYLRLLPTPGTTSGTLRQRYYMRPGRLVATSAVGLISAIDTGTGVITSNIPSTFLTTERFDFVRGLPGFECLGIDATASAVGATTITFATAALPATLAVGDYVCLAGESPIPQVPVELHPYLSQRVVCRALESLGDPKVAQAERTADRLRRHALSLLTPRDEGARRHIINFNGPGWGSASGRRR